MTPKRLFLGGMIAVLFAAPVSGAFDVRDFGAKGDGLSDDTAAIQRAADALQGKERPREAHCVTRFCNTMIDTPFPALVFPKGTYRISGPVVFNHNVMLIGEGGVKVINSSADKETFYFREAHRLMVEGLSFEGGYCHLRQWTRNRDVSCLHISDCSFTGASGVSVVSDSFKDYRGHDAQAKNPSCETLDVEMGADGLYVLAARDEKEMTPYNNSTLIIIERCHFADNVTSFRGYSDGVTVRACEFKAPVGVKSPQIRAGSRGALGVEMFFRDLRFEFPGPAVSGRAAIAFDGGRLHIENSLIHADEDVVGVRSISHACEYGMASQLDLLDVTVDNGSAPVISIEGPWFPNRLAVTSLKTTQRKRRKLFAFDNEPDSAFIKALPQAAERMRCIPAKHCVAVIVDDVDRSVFDCSLPEVLKDFVRKPNPSLRRSYGYRSGAEFSLGLPKGVVFRDESMGALRRKDSGDDTEKFAALLAKAATAGGGVIELPAKWIGISRGFRLPNNTLITCRGRAALELKNDKCATFVATDGVDSVFRNIMFIGGGCAVASRASRGRVRAVDCSFYGQKGPSIRMEADTPATFVMELTGGQAYTPYLYRGNAKFTMDAFWYQESVAYAKEDTSRSYSSMVNLAGGDMRLREMLGVPVYFHFFGKEYLYDKSHHEELKGDYRWVDNYGDLISYSSRYGGEYTGITPIYHFGKARTYMYGGVIEGSGGIRACGQAPVAADSPDADVTLVDLLAGVYRVPLQAVWGKDGKFEPLKSAKYSNNFPYGF